MPSWRRRGDVSVQTVSMLPVVFSVFLVGVHFASLAHAGHAATVISQRGARVAAQSAGGASGIVEALEEMERTAWETRGKSPRRVHVAMDRGTVTATTTLEIDSVLPLIPRIVNRSVTVSRETFVFRQDR